MSKLSSPGARAQALVNRGVAMSLGEARGVYDARRALIAVETSALAEQIATQRGVSLVEAAALVARLSARPSAISKSPPREEKTLRLSLAHVAEAIAAKQGIPITEAAAIALRAAEGR